MSLTFYPSSCKLIWGFTLKIMNENRFEYHDNWHNTWICKFCRGGCCSLSLQRCYYQDSSRGQLNLHEQDRSSQRRRQSDCLVSWQELQWLLLMVSRTWSTGDQTSAHWGCKGSSFVQNLLGVIIRSRWHQEADTEHLSQSDPLMCP